MKILSKIRSKSYTRVILYWLVVGVGVLYIGKLRSDISLKIQAQKLLEVKAKPPVSRLIRHATKTTCHVEHLVQCLNSQSIKASTIHITSMIKLKKVSLKTDAEKLTTCIRQLADKEDRSNVFSISIKTTKRRDLLEVFLWC